MVDIDVLVQGMNLDPIESINKKAQAAMKDTVKDWKSKGNRIVKKHVGTTYSVKGGKITKDCKGFKQTGEYEGHIEYTGAVSSLENFPFSPKSGMGRRIDAAKVPGPGSPAFRRSGLAHGPQDIIQVRQPVPYGISIKVKGGGTISPGSNYFVYNGAIWERNGKQYRKAYGPSVPTMVDRSFNEGMDEELFQMAEESITRNMEKHFG